MARRAIADHEQLRSATLDAHPILHTGYNEALEHNAGVIVTPGARPFFESAGSVRDGCPRTGR